MSIRYFLFLIVLLASSPLFAQWNVGLKGGVNIMSINYDARFYQRAIEQDFKMGYMGGFTFQYFNQPNIGLQIEALYIQKGFKTKFDTLNNLQYERSIDYLTMPMLMHTYIGKRRFNLSLLLGPYISYALSSNEKFTEDGNTTTQDYVWDRERDNRFEFGLQAGIAFRNTFNFGILELEGMYTLGLTSIYKWGVVSTDPDKDKFFPIPEQVQHRGINITLSYYKTFGKIPERLKD